MQTKVLAVSRTGVVAVRVDKAFFDFSHAVFLDFFRCTVECAKRALPEKVKLCNRTEFYRFCSDLDDDDVIIWMNHEDKKFYSSWSITQLDWNSFKYADFGASRPLALNDSRL